MIEDLKEEKLLY